MVSNTPTLNIDFLDSHNPQSIILLDSSRYPVGWVKTNPSIQITPPGFDTVTLAFTPSSAQVYYSVDLGIVCAWCDNVSLPDGIWKFKYSVYPAISYFVEKSFVRIGNLQAKLDELYLTLDITECDQAIKKQDKLFLSNIQDYIEGAVAAGNNCVNNLFTTYYQLATKMINQYINSKACATI